MPTLYSTGYSARYSAGHSASRSSFTASLGLHFLLFIGIIFWTPSLPTPALDDTILPIEIITIDTITRLAPQVAEEKSETAPSPAPAPAAHEAAPPPRKNTPEIVPALTKKPTKTPAKIAEHTPPARPLPPTPPVPSSRLDIGAVRALLNKTPEVESNNAEKATPVEETASRLTASEIDAFRVQMQKCWSPPAGARDAASLLVVVAVSLHPNGRIAKAPVVINRARLGESYFRAAAESVLRAIRRCQPFNMPPEKYAAWRDIELTFDPSKMLGI